jgi:hypothetical protein
MQVDFLLYRILEIPNFPVQLLQGHKGALVLGLLG